MKKWGRKWASCRRYYASLQFTQPEIFLANAKEMYENNRKLPGTLSSGIGLSYCRLKIPKVFCWGNLSLSKATRKYIRAESIENREFRQAFHWLMVDRPQEFYTFLAEFIKKIRINKLQ